MTTPEPQVSTQDQKLADKELNFRKLEAHYEKQLAEARAQAEQAQKMAQEAMNKNNRQDETEDDDTDPYVDKKKLQKTLNRFGEQNKQQTQAEIKQAVQQAIYEERNSNWLKNNPDFQEVMKHAERFAERDPDLAETILEMPNTFERQKLVYKNIKALGMHKPEVKQSSIQEKVDSNRRSPYYQPTGVGSAPYASASDFSASGQKNAYDKMKELQARLRI